VTRAVTGPATTLLSVFPSFRVGGAQTRFAAVANRFGTRYRHLIVSLDGADSARGRLAPDLDIDFPPPLGGRATLAAIRRALRALRPDVLITHNWGSMDCKRSMLMTPLCQVEALPHEACWAGR
jgi:hypothetical protein